MHKCFLLEAPFLPNEQVMGNWFLGVQRKVGRWKGADNPACFQQHMVAAFDLMDKWGYAYVDNLTWVYLAENNAILTMDAPYALASHLTLYIFRRQGLDTSHWFSTSCVCCRMQDCTLHSDFWFLSCC